MPDPVELARRQSAKAVAFQLLFKTASTAVSSRSAVSSQSAENAGLIERDDPPAEVLSPQSAAENNDSPAESRQHRRRRLKRARNKK
ncbi:hypothetical protein Tco_0963466 [Tanacetum coccineum]